MTKWILIYLLALGFVVAINAIRVIRAGGNPFPFLRSGIRTTHGLVEKLLLGDLLLIAGYAVIGTTHPGWLSGLPRFELPPALSTIGSIVLAVSWVLTAGSILWMGPVWRIGIGEAPRQIVASGPYRWIRHPIYAGIGLSAIGTGILCQDVFITVWAGTILITINIQARLEEQFLMANAPGYREYAQRTGRFLPRLRREREKIAASVGGSS